MTGGCGISYSVAIGSKLKARAHGIHRRRRRALMPLRCGRLQASARPIPGQELIEHLAAWSDNLQAGQDIGEPSVGIDVIGSGALHQSLNCGGAMTALIEVHTYRDASWLSANTGYRRQERLQHDRWASTRLL